MVDKKLFEGEVRTTIEDNENIAFRSPNNEGSRIITGLAFKAWLRSFFVWLGNINQTIDGIKSFVKSPTVPDPTTNLQAVNLRTLNDKLGDPKKITFIPQTPAQVSYELATMFYDSSENTWTLYNDISGISLQLGEELRARLVNDTGATLLDGFAVSVTGAVGASLMVELLDASSFDLSIRGFGLMTHTVVDGSPGYAVRYGAVRDIDTSALPAGKIVYGDPEVLGGLTTTRPIAPNYPVRIGICLISDAALGVIGVDTLAFNGSDTGINAEGTLNGIVTQTPNVDFSVSGGIIYADVTNEYYPTKNLPFIIGGVRYLLDTTTNTGAGGAARIIVPPGASDELKEKSYIHVILNGGVPELAVSTSKPSVPNAMICDVTVYNATRTVADGKVFAYRRQNNASDSKTEGVDGSYGFTRVLAEDSRSRGSAWDNGQVGTETVNDTTIKLALTAGVGKQLHYSNTPLFDGNLYEVYNTAANVITYAPETNLFNITLDSNGGTLLGNGFYYVLRLYYKLNSNGIGNDIIATRPSGHYSSGDLAVSDALGYTTDLADTDIEDIVYPLYDLVIGKTGGGGSTTTLFQLIDRRSKTPGVGGGAGGGESAGTDDKIRVSAADTTNDYLDPKISSSDSSITKSITNPGGNEVLDFILADTIPGLKTFINKLTIAIPINNSAQDPYTATGHEDLTNSEGTSGNLIVKKFTFPGGEIGMLTAKHVSGTTIEMEIGLRTSATSTYKALMTWKADGFAYLPNVPATSATSTTPVLTRNASTGAIEQIIQLSTASIVTGVSLTPVGARRENEVYITALASAITINTPSGSIENGNTLIARIKDDGTARALTFNAIYYAFSEALPTTTILGKTMYLLFIYDSAAAKWNLMKVVNEL